MLINELSKRTGISAHTIRFYEKSGLLKGKLDENVKTNKYSHYDEESVERLELVRDAKSIGFTIREISQLMDAWYNNKMTVDEKLKVLDDKLVSITDKIKQLKEMKKMIDQFKKTVKDDAC
ncbi:MAG TPA: MerR family transcriptional regulator [Saprospiraceae bacterium]|nr:MerR family transcriptional regulator [Saprospiraceae bacterium]